MTVMVNRTRFVKEAGQWQVRFRKVAGDEQITLTDEVLLQSSQASAPGVLRRNEDMHDTFDISRMAVVAEESDIRLQVNPAGHGTEGVILIRRR